jgi:dTMP kinase
MSGKFVVVEGLEGAGKSTAISIIKLLIEKQGHEIISTREPGGTPMAESIRDCVKTDWQTEKVTSTAELLLMYAARAQLIENVIKPELSKGAWVLADRHDMSSRAYQGYGHQIGVDKLEPIRQLTLQGFEPDFTLYLDVEPIVGIERARGRGKLDRIEQQDISFFERARAGFLAMVERDPNCHLVSAMQPIEKVHQEIKQRMLAFLEQ